MSATRDGFAATPVSSSSSRRAHACRLSPPRGVPPGSTQSSSPSCVRCTSRTVCLRTTTTEQRTSKTATLASLHPDQGSRTHWPSGKTPPKAWRRVGGIHRRAAQNRCAQGNARSWPGGTVGDVTNLLSVRVDRYGVDPGLDGQLLALASGGVPITRSVTLEVSGGGARRRTCGSRRQRSLLSGQEAGAVTRTGMLSVCAPPRLAIDAWTG